MKQDHEQVEMEVSREEEPQDIVSNQTIEVDTNNANQQGARKLVSATKVDWRDSIVLKTAMFGLNGFFLGVHRLINGKFLVWLGSSGSAASSVVTTTQTIILGTSLSFLLGTGLDFGSAAGKKEYKKCGDIARTGVVLAGVLGLFSTCALLAATAIFPLMFEKDTSKIASNFFFGYVTSCVPQLFLVIGSQVSFQSKDLYTPPLSMLGMCMVSALFSYLLGFTANLGAFGIGLGGTIGSLCSCLALGLWFLLSAKYKKYELFSTWRIELFTIKMKSLLRTGWKLASQRFTEWGNLSAITTILGAESGGKNNLIVINPGILYLNVAFPLIQGFAQSVGMMMARNHGTTQRALQDNDMTAVEIAYKHNIQAIIRSNVFGFLLSVVLLIIFYCARTPLAGFFLPSNIEPQLITLAEHLLWVNIAGLLPDSIRITTSGAFRAWDDMLFPTIISTVCMSVVGIPVGYGFGILYNQPTEMMVYLRNITIFLSLLFMLRKSMTHLRRDAQKLGIEPFPHLPWFSCHFFYQSQKKTQQMEPKGAKTHSAKS